MVTICFNFSINYGDIRLPSFNKAGSGAPMVLFSAGFNVRDTSATEHHFHADNHQQQREQPLQDYSWQVVGQPRTE